MKRRWRVRLGLLAAASLSMSVVMCRDATQMFVEVTTDVPCSEHGGTSVVVGSLDSIGSRAPTTFASTCTGDGKVGTLVIVPSGDDTDDIAFQVTTAIGVDPSTCSAATPSPSCIVARRSLRFLPHESLRLRVPMRRVCAGVNCDPQSTCFNGTCVAATVRDPGRCASAEGCGEEALGAAAPGGEEAGLDGGVESGVDSGVDAPADGPVVDGFVPPGIELAMGEDHVCALIDGGVRCWGRNAEGQLGVGAVGPDGLLPTAIPGLAGVKAIATVGRTTGALMNDGTVYGWGQNTNGELPGQGASPVPAPALLTVPTVAQLCFGTNHGCGLDALGSTLTCWGAKYEKGTDEIVKAIDLGGAEAASVACGDLMTVVRMKDQTMRTFGQASAALGRPGTAGDTPVAVAGVSNVVASATGWQDTIVSLADGKRMAWGINGGSQLTDPSLTQHPTPFFVAPLVPYSSIVAGLFYACGLMGTEVFCWGANLYGQLGPGQPMRSASPVKVALPRPVNKVWAGGSHACARLDTGAIYCWGANDHGQLGGGMITGSPYAHPDPVQVVFPP